MEVVLDTNAYSQWLRSGLWDREISQASKVWMPVIVLGELYHGFHGGSRFQKNEAVLQDFLGERMVEIAFVDQAVAQQFGGFMHYLQVRGTKIPTNDVWIAAIAYLTGGTLLSDDDHFDCLPQVRRMASGARGGP
jgi:tRNA(fMet)-specific endonuclease VapC